MQGCELGSLRGCIVEEEYAWRRARHRFSRASRNDRDGGLGLYLRYGQAECRDQPPQCRYPTSPVVVQSACNKFCHDHHPEQTHSCLQKAVPVSV